MKPAFLLLFLLFFRVIAYGQADTINQTDSNGLKQGFWKIYPEVTVSENKVRQVFLKEGHYCNDQKCGTWVSYFADEKTVKSRCEYVNGQLEGIFTDYFENGRIKNQGLFSDGYFVGIHRSYYEDGKLKSKTTYDSRGKETDSSITYFPDGTKASLAFYDTASHIRWRIDYDRETGLIKRDWISVDQDIDHSFTLNSRNVINTMILPTAPMECYHFKLDFEGTPIYRDYLLVLKADSSYQLVCYDYEQCYNFINTFIGNWSKSDDEIRLFPIESEVKFDRLTIEPNGNLVSKPVLESDRKMRTYTFTKIQL